MAIYYFKRRNLEDWTVGAGSHFIVHSSPFFVSTDKNYHEQCLYGFPRCTAYEPFRVDHNAVKLNLFLVKTISFGTKEQCHTGGRHFIDKISDDMLRWIKSKTWGLFNQ